MVYNRLFSKAEEALHVKATATSTTEMMLTNDAQSKSDSKAALRLKENFSASDIPVSARDTCRNWFYKVACIKEHLPRIYVEITLLKCYRFLTDSEFPSILAKLGSFIRGDHNYISSYSRSYAYRLQDWAIL